MNGGLERPAVLVTSGAYNPVHANHLLYLEAARAFVQRPAPAGAVRGPVRRPGHPESALPLQVVGAYVSALPDRMVARQRDWAIARPHRTAMLQLAAASTPWLTIVDEDLHGVALFRELGERVAATLGQPVCVVAVCGADGYRASDRFLPAHIPLACVRRTGEDEQWRALWDEPATGRTSYLIEDNLQPRARSSTQIRNWLRQADDERARAELEANLHPDVLRYLLDHPELHA